MAANHQFALAHELTGSGEFGPPALRHRTGGYVPPPPQQMSAGEELSQMRRTKLGNLSSKKGSAEFFVLLTLQGSVEDVKFISGDEQFRPLSKILASLKFKAPLPDDAPVKLVRRGVLVCESGTLGCDFTLFPVDSVHSTE